MSPSSSPTTLVVPFALPLDAAAREAFATLSLPGLASLRERLVEHSREIADEWTLSTPHERAFARAVGWSGADGALPFAAHAAAVAGLDPGDLAWAQLTPVHWHLGTEQVSLVDPAGLMLDEAGSRAFFDAVQPLMAEEGWLLAFADAGRWFAAHEVLAGLPTASLDRVIGRNVDSWLGQDAAARRLRRLQAEIQMLLHRHPENVARESRGLLPVNSVWVSGSGVRQPLAAPAPVVDERLRGPALAGDWARWCTAWETLDGELLTAWQSRAEAGEAVAVTLCGERGSVTLGGPPRQGWQRWWQRWGQPPAAAWLEAL